MKKLCVVATIPAAVHAFLRGHIQAAAEHFEVTVICNSADKHLLDGLNARLILLPIERKPSPRKDLLVLIQLFGIFRAERFDIVHSHLPKTGLLGMLAAWMARVPVRINTFHGEVWATRTGWQRAALKLFDRIVGKLATDILVVSPSQRDFLVNEGVLSPGKASVIGAGSICGVDPIRFAPNSEFRRESRRALGIGEDAKVILFVGRLNRDKGMLDLAAAFNTIAAANSNVELLLVGAEENVPFSYIQEICHTVSNRIHYKSFTSAPEYYMAAADIFCLPSYREGFGLTIIEAAACGIPAVASRIYGISDAIDDGKTGLLFPAGDVNALTRALLLLISENELRLSMGRDARKRALDLFSSEKITREICTLYDKLYEESQPDWTNSDKTKSSPIPKMTNIMAKSAEDMRLAKNISLPVQDQNTKFCLVTGANGFIGRSLVKQLGERGFRVRAAVRTDKEPINNVEMVKINTIDDETNWKGALHGIDVIIHTAARVHVMSDYSITALEAFRHVNVAGTVRLARLAAASGVKRLVYVSSIKVNGAETLPGKKFEESDSPSPQDAYGISKWEAEQALYQVAKDTGLEVVIVRSPLVYGEGAKGNFAKMLEVLAKGVPLPFASVQNQRSLIFIDNLVDSLIVCATNPVAAGQTYLVSDGEDISTSELLIRIGAGIGHPARLFACPDRLLHLVGKLIGKSAHVSRLLGSCQLNSDKIRTQLDWKPPYTLQQGLQITAERYRATLK